MQLVYSPRYVVAMGRHVFSTEKFRLAVRSCRAWARTLEPDFPSREDMRLVHDASWADKISSAALTGPEAALMQLPPGKAVCAAHRLQVSGTIMACDLALKNGVGLHAGGGSHHAFRDHGEGYCMLNDIACGIVKMKKARRIGRACVIDLDVHQGNGTAAIFAGDEDVFTFSMHQKDLYPEKKERSSLDIELKAGTCDDEYLRFLEKGLVSAMEHRPDLVVYQAGVDCWERDRLGGLKLTAQGLARRDEMVLAACRKHRIAVAVTLGGGYADDVRQTAFLHSQTLHIFAGVRRKFVGTPHERAL